MLNVPIGAYMGASRLNRGGVAYVGTFENEVIGIGMKSKKVLWQYRHPERLFPFYSSAAVSQDRIVVGGRDKMVHALDAKTGKAFWTFMTNARVDSSPAIVGNRVFVGSSDGRLYVLDLAKGGKLWEFDAGARDHRVAGRCLRPPRRRHPGRPAVLLRLESLRAQGSRLTPGKFSFGGSGSQKLAIESHQIDEKCRRPRRQARLWWARRRGRA